MSESKNVLSVNSEIYDFLAHEYGYSIEYIKDLDVVSIANLTNSAIRRKRKEMVQLCNLIRVAVWGNRDVSESDVPEENDEDNLRRLIKTMTKASDEQISEMKDKGIEVPI